MKFESISDKKLNELIENGQRKFSNLYVRNSFEGTNPIHLHEAIITSCYFEDVIVDLKYSQIEQSTFAFCKVRNLLGCYVSATTVSECYLMNTSFKGVICESSKFVDSHIGSASFSLARMTDCDFSKTTFFKTSLRMSTFEDCSFNNATWSNVDACGARLIRCSMGNVLFLDSSLAGANMSGSKLPRRDHILDSLEKVDGGVIAYKAIGLCFDPPDHWRIKPGEWLEECVNPDELTQCSSGVNVANLSWFNDEHIDSVWKVFIPWESMVLGVIPFNSDGKFRVPRCKLIEKVNISDLR